MASFYTHIAIAKRWLEKNPGIILDEQAFIDGNVEPDLTDDKNATHFGVRNPNSSLIRWNADKVSLEKFLATYQLDSDYNRGMYLHLMTDFVYYNQFLPSEYLETKMREDMIRDNSFTAKHFNGHLIAEYGVSYYMTSHGDELTAMVGAWDDAVVGGELLFSAEQLDEFIERMSETKIAIAGD